MSRPVYENQPELKAAFAETKRWLWRRLAAHSLVSVLAATLLFAGSLWALARPGSQESTQSPPLGTSVMVALYGRISSLDPLLSSDPIDRQVLYNIYDSLLTIDPKGNLRPGMATQWEISSDGKAITLTLRTGARFQDGTLCDASVVKFNLDRYLKDGGAANQRRSELSSIDSVEAPNSATAILHLNKPDGTLFASLVDRAGMMLSPSAVKAGGQDFGAHPFNAGSGPFMFAEFKPNDHVTLRRNLNYWNGVPFLNEVIYSFQNDPANAYSALKSGSINISNQVDFNDFLKVKSNPALTYNEIPSFGFGGIELNHKRVFRDASKRKALAMAIDRRKLVETVFANLGAISYGPLSPSQSMYFDPTEKIFDYADPQTARSIATNFAFSLKTESSPAHVEEARLIQTQLKFAGITVLVQPESQTQLDEDAKAGNFDAALVGSTGTLDPDGTMYNWFHTKGIDNLGSYTNSEVDRLLDEARTATIAARGPDYQQAQRMLVSDVAFVFIWHPPALEITSARVRGLVAYPDDIYRFAKVTG